MTTANFETIPIDSITIDREGRQRKELTRLEELETSIREVGLINPPVVTPTLELVAGERRVTACRNLGWTQIPVQYTSDLSELELHLIELEENVKRIDLTWQEHTLAIEQYHALKSQKSPEWKPTDTAKSLGVDERTVTRHLAVAKHLEDPEVAKSDRFSVARGLVERKNERAKRETKTKVSQDIDELIGTSKAKPDLGDEGESTPAPAAGRPVELLNTDFLRWASTYEGEPFNFLHCDFPYGIDFHKANRQNSRVDHGTYEDSEATYFKLLSGMLELQDRFVAPQAHLMFWFSMDYYQRTLELLQSHQWEVNPFPLIWFRSDNKGLLPDPSRGPRRVYETALLASRGDRKVVRAVANTVACSTTRDFHTSEKPHKALDHFFRMLVDESTRLLDPTCGSGMAVKVGEEHLAAHSLGIELSESSFNAAKENVGI